MSGSGGYGGGQQSYMPMGGRQSFMPRAQSFGMGRPVGTGNPYGNAAGYQAPRSGGPNPGLPQTGGYGGIQDTMQPHYGLPPQPQGLQPGSMFGRTGGVSTYSLDGSGNTNPGPPQYNPDGAQPLPFASQGTLNQPRDMIGGWQPQQNGRFPINPGPPQMTGQPQRPAAPTPQGQTGAYSGAFNNFLNQNASNLRGQSQVDLLQHGQFNPQTGAWSGPKPPNSSVSASDQVIGDGFTGIRDNVYYQNGQGLLGMLHGWDKPGTPAYEDAMRRLRSSGFNVNLPGVASF